MSMPKGIQFKSAKPLGFFQEYRDYYVTPVQTYSNTFSVSDIVRMQFNIPDWYIDPYESFIEAQVQLVNETPIVFSTAVPYDNTNLVQFLMMDGPSTSLINDFRLEVNSREIERIREYDQVGNLLTDLNMYPDAIDQKDYEGYFSLKNYKTSQEFQQQSQQLNAYQGVSGATNYPFSCGGSNCPVFAQKMHTILGSEPVSQFQQFFNTLGPAAANTFNLNSAVLCNYETSLPTSYTGVRIGMMKNSLPALTEAAVGGGSYAEIYNPSQFLGQLTSANTNFGIQNDACTANSIGTFYAMNSPKLNQVDGHNIFLTNLPTSKIVNGKFQNDVYTNVANTAQTRTYMQIPLLSGVMGVLIPGDRWQLIPSSSLGNVNMEFRFNPNAFFSHNGAQPNWSVTTFQLKLRMYRFDTALQQQLKAQVQSGIVMHSQIFSLGPIYNIQPNVSVTNNWQINNGIPSIKQLFFWFLSNDYETYNYARKNFKLSQNLTSMQLKTGSTYIPQNPIIGHAGNIILNQNIPADNSQFLSELHSSLNLLFDCKKHININKLNFAINQRCYDVTMSTALGLTAAQLTAKKKQMLLDGGYTLWNEMRCRGKAVYSFNLDYDKKNDDTMTGLDTTKTRPIELILKSTDPNTYANSSTMYVMFLSDFIVTFKDGETSTEGSG